MMVSIGAVRRVKPWLIASALLIATPSMSQDSPQYEVTASVGVVTGGDFQEGPDGASLDVDDGQVLGLALHATSRLGGQYEFSWWRDDAAFDRPAPFAGGDDIDLTIDYFQVGGTYVFERRDAFQPYFLLTVGASRLDPRGEGLDSETFFAATGGAGFRFDLSPRFTLKLETRAFLTWIGDDESVFCVSGAGGGACAITADGSALIRWSAIAGFAYRF